MADNILIIEKEHNAYLRLDDLLVGLGMKTRQAKNAIEAENLLQGNLFYAIFIDISTISDISEIEHILSTAKPHSIVIVMGDDTQYAIISRAIEMGADDFLHLPFDNKLFSIRTKMVFDRVLTERKKNTDYLNSLIDIIPAMMIITDGNGRVVNANYSAVDKFGKTKKSCIGSMLGEFINCSKANKLDSYCHENCGFCQMYEYERDAIVSGKANIRREYTYTRASKDRTDIKTLRVSVAPIEYGGKRSVIINLEDISFERNSIKVLTDTLFNLQQSYSDSQDKIKGSEELAKYLQDINDNLQKERNKLQLLFDNMSAGFLLLKRDSSGDLIIADGNSKFDDMFHVNSVNYIGRNIKSRLCDSEQKFFEAANKVFETSQAQHIQMSSTSGDQWYNVDMYMPEHDYLAVIVQDISEEIKNQKKNKDLTFQLKKQNVMLDDKIMELRKTKDQLELFMEGSRDGAWCYRYGQDFFYVSNQYKKQLGYEPDEIELGHKDDFFKYVLPPEDHEWFKAKLGEVQTGQTDMFEEEVRLKTKSGECIWVLMRAIVKRNVDGTPIVLGGVNTNITDRKRNEQVIRAQNSELQKAIDTKNKFISIIAHDLRNPFNAINGLSEMLVQKLKQSEEPRCLEMAKIINDSGKSAYELLNNLLVWARSQQNTIQFAPEWINVHSTVGETVKEIKVQADKKHIMLLNNTEPDDVIWADKQMLQTIVRNIASNAIKFTNENGLVVINSHQREKDTIIIIEDNGVGMSQETIQKLMNVSKNKSTPGTAGEKGSGMGLLISKEFIDKHHGTIKVESEEGMGSKFIITFPSGSQLKLADI